MSFWNFQKFLRGPLFKVLADDTRPYLRGPLFRGPLKFFKGPLILRCLQMTRAIMQFVSALLQCCKMVGHLSMIQFTCQLFFLLQVWLYIKAHIYYYIQPLPTNLKVGKASQLKHRKRLQTLESTWKKPERKKSWGSFLHFLLMRSATKKANLFYPPTPNHHTEVASSQILIKVETLEWGRRTLKRPPSRILKILGSNTRVSSVQE